MIRVLYCDFDKDGKSRQRMSNVQPTKKEMEKFLDMKFGDYSVRGQNIAYVYGSYTKPGFVLSGSFNTATLGWEGKSGKLLLHQLQDQIFSHGIGTLGKMIVFQGFNI